MYYKCINCMYVIINLNKFLLWNKYLEKFLSIVNFYVSLVWKFKDY